MPWKVIVLLDITILRPRYNVDNKCIDGVMINRASNQIAMMYLKK